MQISELMFSSPPKQQLFFTLAQSSDNQSPRQVLVPPLWFLPLIHVIHDWPCQPLSCHWSLYTMIVSLPLCRTSLPSTSTPNTSQGITSLRAGSVGYQLYHQNPAQHRCSKLFLNWMDDTESSLPARNQCVTTTSLALFSVIPLSRHAFFHQPRGSIPKFFLVSSSLHGGLS